LHEEVSRKGPAANTGEEPVSCRLHPLLAERSKMLMAAVGLEESQRKSNWGRTGFADFEGE
jgi:hypothetical protein